MHRAVDANAQKHILELCCDLQNDFRLVNRRLMAPDGLNRNSTL